MRTFEWLIPDSLILTLIHQKHRIKPVFAYWEHTDDKIHLAEKRCTRLQCLKACTSLRSYLGQMIWYICYFFGDTFCYSAYSLHTVNNMVHCEGIEGLFFSTDGWHILIEFAQLLLCFHLDIYCCDHIRLSLNLRFRSHF